MVCPDSLGLLQAGRPARPLSAYRLLHARNSARRRSGGTAEPRPSRIPSGPVGRRRGRRLLPGQLDLPLLPWCPRLSQPGPAELGANRQRPRPSLAAAARSRHRIARHLCPHHPLQRRNVLYDHHQRGRRRKLHGHRHRPGRPLERTDMAGAAGHRPVALF